MKQIHVRSRISSSKWPSVCITSPDLDASFITEHDAMTLQDNEWTEMVENWMYIEDDEDIINEDLEKLFESIDNFVVEVDEDNNE